MFDFSKIEKNLISFPGRLEKALEKYGETSAVKLEGEAKKNRPWTDRTSHARQRMSGRCEKNSEGIRIYLSHGVDYGIYLELAHEKMYAVIYPTLRKEAPEIMGGLMGMIEKI